MGALTQWYQPMSDFIALFVPATALYFAAIGALVWIIWSVCRTPAGLFVACSKCNTSGEIECELSQHAGCDACGHTGYVSIDA